MKKSTKISLSVLVTVLLLCILFYNVDFSIISEFYGYFSIRLIVASFLIYFFMNVFRAIRLRVIFPKTPFAEQCSIVFIHNMFNNILPFRIGELSYIYMIKKREGGVNAVSSLMFLRFMDTLGISLIFIFAFFFVRGMSPLINDLFYFLVALFILMIAAYAVFQRYDILPGILKRFNKLNRVFVSFKKYSWKTFIPVFAHSIIIWLLSFWFYHYLINNFGVELNFFYVIVTCILVVFSYVLPIHGVAGFGTIEAAWVIGLMTFGIDKDVAVISGLIIHLMRIIYFLIIGGIGFIISLVD